MKKLLLLIILSTLQSCLMPPTTQKFNPVLESVEHEGEGVHGGMSYQDSIIQIKWTYTATAFEFTMLNKTNKSLKVLWEESAYIDENGESKRVFHKGVKYIDRSQTQPSTTVIRGSVLSDLVAPVDKVNYMSGQYGGWYTRPLFEVNSWTTSGAKEVEDKIRGKTVSILLPIVYEGRTREFIFNFLVK
jgi:hypothetical protein